MARSCHKHTTIMIALALLCNLPLAAALVANNHAAGPLSSAWATATPKRTTFMTRPSSSSLSLSPWDMPAIVPGTLNRSSRVTYRSFRKSTALSDAAADNVAPSAPSPPTQTKTMVATAALLLLDAQFRSLFTKYTIPFPSSLAGCGALFSTMIFLSILDEKWGDDVYQLLNPGANLLAKWLPVFFVPSLITLPLASGLGNALEVFKVFSIIIGGFFFTLLTTAGSVLVIRKLMGGETEITPSPDLFHPFVASSIAVTNTPPKAFSTTLFRTLKSIAWITGISTVAIVKKAPTSQWVTPLQSAYLLSTTLSAFVFGANLPKSFTKAVHPLVTCTTLTWLMANLLASLTGSTFLNILKTYKSGTLAPLSAGPGDILLFLLGPAVVALACQMYGRKKLMRENIPEVGVSTLVSSLGGLYGTAAAVRLLSIGNPMIRLSLLSRNITSPLAMAIASILGADVSLAVTIVVLTGLFGANFGASILDSFGIKDAVARGLGMGAAAHGLGTAAFANEKDAFPFAAIAMALTASACTVLVSIPLVKNSVLKLALGV